MTYTALIAMLAAQVATGVLSGVVTNESGKPEAGVRVAAISTDDRNGDELLSIDRTDENGHYRLEVPFGRYTVLAGRLECPTYHPGTKQRASATEISVTAGSTTDKIDLIAAVESIYRPSVLLSTPCDKSEWAALMRAFLAGSTRSIGGAKFIFELQGVKDRTVSFLYGQRQSSSYGCPDCDFLVTEDRIGPRTQDPGILFRLSPSGESLGLTCHAKGCHVISVSSEGAPQVLRLKQNEQATVSTLAQVAFAVVP
jgi:hypothetical protein